MIESNYSFSNSKFSLRHLSGITGHIPSSMIFDSSGNSIISISGENLLITPLSGPMTQGQLNGASDQSRQQFMKGHDDSVTCIDAAH